MKKAFRKFKWKLYCNLSHKVEQLLPKEYEPEVTIGPCCKPGTDMVCITLKIPRHITRKLMWAFKVWKEN